MPFHLWRDILHKSIYYRRQPKLIYFVIQTFRLAVVIVGICLLGGGMCALADDDDTMGGANVGERLFLETRFAEFFFTNSGGNPNAVLMNGDPVMDTTATIYGPLPGSFAGQSMNCRACHLVEEHENTGNRTYCDFASRSPVPNIGDGRLTIELEVLTCA